MKKHKKEMKKIPKEGSMVGEAMESPEEEAAEGGMKKGGKVKKKMAKAEGGKSKMRLDKPMKRADGGSVLDVTNDGVSPSSPFAIGSPMRGGKK